MNKHIGLIVGGALVVVIVIFASGSSNKNKAGEITKQDVTTSAETNTADSMMPEKDTISGEGAGMHESQEMMKKAGSYEAYFPEKLARATTGDVVLFFHASWCPSCRALSADIEKNMKSIPTGLSILKVDYDASTELKKKYGVTSQHTLVQVSADGALIKKWSGSPNLSSLVSQIQ